MKKVLLLTIMAPLLVAGCASSHQRPLVFFSFPIDGSREEFLAELGKYPEEIQARIIEECILHKGCTVEEIKEVAF